MNCPHCQSSQVMVINSRPTKKNLQIWRRRKCLSCSKVFSTYESVDLSYMKVIKKSGKKERYIRSKLLVSVYQALVDGKAVDRGLAAEMAEKLTQKIERKIVLRNKDSIGTKTIGDLALERLKANHPDSFLRYLAYFKGQSPKAIKQRIKF